VKYRTGLFVGGTALLLLLLVPGSLSVFAQRGTAVAPVLLSITVTPADAEILPDGTQHFTATGTYSDRSIHELSTTVTWSSSAPDVATISGVGLARGVGVGQTTIKAAVGVINSSTTLNVTRFVWTGSMGLPEILHTATLLNNGMALIAGGTYDPNSAELYNPATRTFSDTGSPNGSVSHTATLLNNGMVLIAGGSLASPYGPATASAELYNPATGTFSPTGSMNAARTFQTATLLNNGMVLITGGCCSNPSSNYPFITAELYNPVTGTFTATGSMNTARYWHTATLLNNGMVLIAGGWGGYPNGILGSAELYDPATGTFTPTGSLNTARDLHTATLLNNSTVLIAGGAIAGWSGGPATASVELYDPVTGTFSYTGSLNTARIYHTATLLNNGMVLLAGGEDSSYGNALASAELYDPAAETFTPTSGMNIARFWDTGTLLNNGMVLIAGGFIATAELYEPATLTPPDLESIAITPERPTLSPGETQRFIATGTFSDGSRQQLASVTWSSSDPSVAQITNDASNHGVALAIAPGTSLIEARAGRKAVCATVTVQYFHRQP
jgi:hypothetical protein